MTDILKRIKRAVLTGNYAFSEKARIENGGRPDYRVGCRRIYTQCSGNIQDCSIDLTPSGEIRAMLHIIQSTNLNGLAIYTKGKLVCDAGQDSYYFLISSKRAL